MGKQSTKLKNKLKSLRSLKINKKIDGSLIDTDSKISILKSQIKSCEYDLTHSFTNNKLIVNKINVLTEQIKELEALHKKGDVNEKSN